MADHLLLRQAWRGAVASAVHLATIAAVLLPPSVRRLAWDDKIQLLLPPGWPIETFGGDVRVVAQADISVAAAHRTVRRAARRIRTLLAVPPSAILERVVDLPPDADGDLAAVAKLNLSSWCAFEPGEAVYAVDRLESSRKTAGCSIRISLVPRAAIDDQLAMALQSKIPVDGLYLPGGRSIPVESRRGRARRAVRLLDFGLVVAVVVLSAIGARVELGRAEAALRDAEEQTREVLAGAKGLQRLRTSVAELQRAHNHALTVLRKREVLPRRMSAISELVPEGADVQSLELGEGGFDLVLTVAKDDIAPPPDHSQFGDLRSATLAIHSDGTHRVRWSGQTFP